MNKSKMSSTISNDTLHYSTTEYVENILKRYLKHPTLQVKEIHTTAASAKGESYCSIMTRFRVKYNVNGEKDLKEINYLVKATNEDNPLVTGILLKYDVYNTEMQMYETVFPQLHELLREIGDTDQLCAKTIYVDHQLNAIICEDLTVRQFTLADRLKGMNEAQVKVSLRKLAKMHATAAVLNERHAGSLEKFTYGILNRHVNFYGVFFENVIRVCAKFAGTCPELGTYYKDKLLKLIPYTADYGTRCYEPKSNNFLTLNHGDMWTNNVMIRYHNERNEGDDYAVKDALLIDFQYCNWTSPAIDLHYFFSTSLQDDVLLYQQPQLIKYYHEILTDTLEMLKYKQHIPTLHEFHVQLKERGFYAVTAQLVNFPLMVNDKTDDADLESIVGSDEKAQRFHNVLYTSDRVQRIIKVMLPRFDKLGLLDIVD